MLWWQYPCKHGSTWCGINCLISIAFSDPSVSSELGREAPFQLWANGTIATEIFALALRRSQTAGLQGGVRELRVIVVRSITRVTAVSLSRSHSAARLQVLGTALLVHYGRLQKRFRKSSNDSMEHARPYAFSPSRPQYSLEHPRPPCGNTMPPTSRRSRS